MICLHYIIALRVQKDLDEKALRLPLLIDCTLGVGPLNEILLSFLIQKVFECLSNYNTKLLSQLCRVMPANHRRVFWWVSCQFKGVIVCVCLWINGMIGWSKASLMQYLCLDHVDSA